MEVTNEDEENQRILKMVPIIRPKDETADTKFRLDTTYGATSRKAIRLQ